MLLALAVIGISGCDIFYVMMIIIILITAQPLENKIDQLNLNIDGNAKDVRTSSFRLSRNGNVSKIHLEQNWHTILQAILYQLRYFLKKCSITTLMLKIEYNLLIYNSNKYLGHFLRHRTIFLLTILLFLKLSSIFISTSTMVVPFYSLFSKSQKTYAIVLLKTVENKVITSVDFNPFTFLHFTRNW